MSSSVDISALAQVRGQTLFAFRRADERRRIGVEKTFAPQVPAERADRGQLARRRGAGIPPPVQVGQELADAQEVEVRHRQVDTPAAGAAGEEREELREIAVVGADRVPRGVLVEPKMLEEIAERRLHRSDPGELETGFTGVHPALEIGERPLRHRQLARLLATHLAAIGRPHPR